MEEEPPRKKPRYDAETPLLLKEVKEMKEKALKIWIEQMEQGTVAIYKDIYGEHWQEGMRYENEKLAQGQEEARLKKAQFEASQRKRREMEKVSLTGTGVFLDDYDPRY